MGFGYTRHVKVMYVAWLVARLYQIRDTGFVSGFGADHGGNLSDLGDQVSLLDVVLVVAALVLVRQRLHAVAGELDPVLVQGVAFRFGGRGSRIRVEDLG